MGFIKADHSNGVAIYARECVSLFGIKPAKHEIVFG